MDDKTTDRHMSFVRDNSPHLSHCSKPCSLQHSTKTSGRRLSNNVFSPHPNCLASLWQIFLSFLLGSYKTDLLFLYGFRPGMWLPWAQCTSWISELSQTMWEKATHSNLLFDQSSFVLSPRLHLNLSLSVCCLIVSKWWGRNKTIP